MRLDKLISKSNIETIHKSGIALSLIVVTVASVYGAFKGEALVYIVLYSMRALGLYLLFYVLRCIVLGKERIISSGWTDEEFTYENYPYQFIYLILMTLFFSAIMLGTWFVFDV